MEFIKSVLEWIAVCIGFGILTWIVCRGILVVAMAAFTVLSNPLIVILPFLVIWLVLSLSRKFKKEK